MTVLAEQSVRQNSAYRSGCRFYCTWGGLAGECAVFVPLDFGGRPAISCPRILCRKRKTIFARHCGRRQTQRHQPNRSKGFGSIFNRAVHTADVPCRKPSARHILTILRQPGAIISQIVSLRVAFAMGMRNASRIGKTSWLRSVAPALNCPSLAETEFSVGNGSVNNRKH